MDAEKITVTLGGKEYELAWGNLPRARLSGIPAEIRALGGAVSVATLVWAAMKSVSNPFLTWEHVAQHITPENISELDAALAKLSPAEPDEAKKN